MPDIHKREVFHDLSLEHLFSKLESRPTGLTESEADERLGIFGRNSLPEGRHFSALILFLRQFQNPLFYILLFAMILSFVMGHQGDGLIIAFVVVISGIIGFIQEFKANKALAKLNSIITYKAKAMRNGLLGIIDQEELVPGDMIELAPGDIIPADARLLSVSDLKVSEALLTGESSPSEKFVGELPLDTPLADRDNMVFQGTLVNQGTARALVVATAARTEMGQIARLLQETTEAKTPLQLQIGVFSKWLSLFLVLANLVIFLVGLALGRPFFEMFMISVVVVVSAVPEGLIPAMSIVLALGMQKLIKKKGLVRKIVSAETLGAVSVICTDKTGTLTEGEMSVEDLVSNGRSVCVGKQGHLEELDRASQLILKIGSLSNDALSQRADNDGLTVIGNPTDKALLLASLGYGLSRQDLEELEPRLAELPFSSENKLMATLHKLPEGGFIIYVKGAPERLLPRLGRNFCGADGQEKGLDSRHLSEELDGLAADGRRIIAFAYKKVAQEELALDDLSDLVYVGAATIRDRVRADAKEAIGLCRRAGIRVVMITGDHMNTALAIGRELGIAANQEQVLTGVELDKLSEQELQIKAKQVVVYARVEPKHKLAIISALQAEGEIVAMTGDGVNDAPALKKADIGVAMGNGTDVAKQVADLVLLDSSFMTIVEAVKQGRTTFGNIKKVVTYLFTDCFQEMVIIGTSVLAGWPLPILPAQILWIKLIEDPLPATSLSFEESKSEVLNERPRRKNEALLTKPLKYNIAFYVFFMDILALLLFYYYWQVGGDVDKARTVMFAALGTSTLFNIYNIRSLGSSVFRTNPFKNHFLFISTVIGFLLFLAAIYLPKLNGLLSTVPLSLLDWLTVFLYAFAALLVFEIGKILNRYKY
jgi:Ca2+-transporting ATPase